jgi:hypothetical protein
LGNASERHWGGSRWCCLWAYNDTMDANKMAAIVKQANKVKKMVVDKALSQAEDPAVVKARELAADARLREEALERRIRELAHSRSARIDLNGAAINDDFARLIAKELGKMTAALPKAEAAGAAGAGAGTDASSSRFSDAARYDPSTLIDESDVGSDEEDEGYVRLRDVKWPDDPAVAVEGPDTSDSDSERSFRYTPRNERVFVESEPIKYFDKVLTAPYVPPGSRQQLDGLEGPAGRGCAVLELSKNQIGGKGCAYVCGWLRVSALHTLVLSDNPLGDSGVTLLGRAIYQAAQLRTLALQR